MVAAVDVAVARSLAGPVPLSPRNVSSDTRPPSAMATAASSSLRDFV
jgi:hypothetical protein